MREARKFLALTGIVVMLLSVAAPSIAHTAAD